MPLASQASLVQVLLSLQTLATPVQAPDLQASLLVHALPSLQRLPSLRLVNTQLPVVVSQVSAVQALPSLQTLAVPAQVPLWQLSGLVQALPSSHTLPLATGVYTQLPVVESQVSAVHTLLSLQVLAVPPHLPALQVSGLVQALPSLQPVPSTTLA